VKHLPLILTLFLSLCLSCGSATTPAGKNDTANLRFTQLLKTKTGNSFFDMGIRYYNLDNYDKAEIIFQECIEQNIKKDTSIYKLAYCFFVQNQTEKGIALLKELIRLNPRYVNAYFNLGAACYDTRQYPQSVFYYEQADKLRPNDDRIFYGIAASQNALQQYDSSLTNCKRALEINAANANAKLLLGMLHDKLH
jgi:tetratricopeptide (TPR) repeat protein